MVAIPTRGKTIAAARRSPGLGYPIKTTKLRPVDIVTIRDQFSADIEVLKVLNETK